MEEINSIKELINEINRAPKEEFAAIFKRISISEDTFRELAQWKEDGYTRNCIARTDEYELLLLCWSPGVETPVHGHGGQDCWVYCAQGEVMELRFLQDAQGDLIETEKLILKKGELSYMKDELGFHSVNNVTKKPAMTVHLYALPIDECKVYNVEDELFERKKMEYDSKVG